MSVGIKRGILFFLFSFFLTVSCFAQVRLPKLVSDGMVLQRDSKVKIWGWASKNEKVDVKFKGKIYKTRADANGQWSVLLAPMKAGGPYTMNIAGRNKITIDGILIGDVWLCSGQSNMEYQLGYDDATYGKEMAEVNNPEIRQFKVPTRPVLTGPESEMTRGSWEWANPKNIAAFTAVGYFFAKHLFEKYHVPIGLINSSVGGTPIEAWISEDGLKRFPDIMSTVTRNKDTAYINSTRRRVGILPRQRRGVSTNDKGLNGPIPWYDSAYVPKGWRTITVPAFWEDQGIEDLNGTVWYRKEIDIPSSMVGKPSKIYLGRIIDANVLYINGKEVGRTPSMYSERRYHIPADLLKTGKNLFVVKITNNNGKGGFVPDKPYYLFSGSDTVSLVGYWQYKVGEVFAPRTGSNGGNFVSTQNSPTALYNGMIAPVINYTIKGFLWYQGASNVTRANQYLGLQTAQITDWRKKWNLGNLPFLFVQLPNYGDYNYLPSESDWALLRDAQFKALSIPNTAMAVTIDIGEWNDIHPWNKEEPGTRLALLAEKIAYGESIVSSGPLFQSAKIEGDKIVLSFTNVGSGLIANDRVPLSEFAVAGADKKFVWAKARIEGNKVIVSSKDVARPLYVRYAWASSPVDPNLSNKEGLPASPFRTDHFSK